MRNDLTQERLKELLHYDPETGVFTWRVHVGSAQPGQVAGAWEGYGYRFMNVLGHRYTHHRLAYLYMTGSFPPNQLDHINGVRSDNRWVNLRPATDAQNRQNMKKKVGTRSTLQGVTWFPRDGTWMSRLMHNYKSYFLGYFGSETEAHEAYLTAKAQLHTFQPTPRTQ